MAGYSGTPLAQKLGLKPGFAIVAVESPVPYGRLVELPAGVVLKSRVGAELDLIHLFVTARRELARQLPRLLKAIKRDGTIWVSWPKRSSGVDTDLTEDTIRAEALPLGLVDVKVCAVDETWSGLKLVIRKTLR